ncbi:MAG: glucose/mannose transport system substrate-binding protein [Micromonosporaceae bacterium]
MWQGRIWIIALLVIATIVAMPLYLRAGGAASGRQVEVYSWWTGPGEENGLRAMVKDFEARNPGAQVVNAAVSGGAGSNAKAILATRLLANDPPDSYQRHAGLELADDIRSGKVQDLTSLYQAQGWTKVFPAGLLDKLTIDGKIYAVPVNIHRANIIWYKPETLRQLGLAGPPKTWSEFLSQAAAIRAKGRVPLTIGPEWTQKHLLETVLLGVLGPDRYERLWTDSASWKDRETLDALGIYKRVLAQSDIASSAADWQPQLDRVMDGSAVYTVMGDWAYSYLAVTKKLIWQQNFSATASPGTQGIYDFLSDSFTLPTGARHPDLARKWLIECGSVAGEDLFNPQKGSVPARTDADPTKYTGYLAGALQQWRDPHTRIVGSLAHGVVADNAWNAEIDTALGFFVQDGDVGKFADTVAAKYGETR